MKRITTIILLFTSIASYGQLFDNERHMDVVRKGIQYIYNAQGDSAEVYIDSVDALLPGHPAAPMMKAMNILWSNVPLVTQDKKFKDFTEHLQETIKRAGRLKGKNNSKTEAIFFEMTARGLLAEYYADDGHYMKALGEANEAYSLIKEGFKLAEDEPEFLLTTGVYNYFRVKYPERHPVYKPLVWFFKDGDIELGLAQLEEATRKATLTRVEAYVYLAYIYLRYEYKPEKAQHYFEELTRFYPQNPYFQVKYYESLAATNSIKKASIDRLKALSSSTRPYYKMAGEAFWGMYLEKVLQNQEDALQHYRQAIAAGNGILDHGEHYRSLAYLGLGRVYAAKGQAEEAAYHLNKAISLAEKGAIEQEAEELLSKL